MTPTQYQELAQRTSATVENHQSILDRANDRWLLNFLSETAGHVMLQARRMDLIKKHLFYGRPIEDDGGASFASIPASEAVAIVDRLSAVRTMKLLHGVIGKITEAGELMEAISDHLFGGMDLDKCNLNEEVGDGLWYDAEIISALGSSFEGIMQNNIDKLKARYGDKFNEEGALNRDLVNERNILEGGCTCGLQLTEIDSNCPMHGNMR